MGPGIMVFKNGKISQSSNGAAYDGSKQMGDLSGWWTFSSDPNGIAKGTYSALTEGSTTLYHTYAPVRGAVNKQVEYGIGPGLVFRSMPDAAGLGMSKDYAISWGKEFQRIVDYYFKSMNFYEKQSILARTGLVAGDSFLMFLRGDRGLLSDLIEVSGDQIDSGYEDGSHTLGIAHDEWLRASGFRKIDGRDVPYFTNGARTAVRFYVKELARQLRGYPIAYSILNLARNDDTHTDAVTHRAVLESIIMAVFKGNVQNFNKMAANLADRNKQARQLPVETNIFKRMRQKLGPGNIFTMQTGEEYELTDLKTPARNFEPFKNWIFKYGCMAMGTPPEVAMSEYSTSFTAHKGALNDFMKSYIKKRRTLERTVMDPVISEILADAVMNGYISAPGFLDGTPITKLRYLRGMYLGPIPGHINPLVEVKAEKESVNSGFKLRSDVASQNGYEWDSFIKEWAQEQVEFTKYPDKYVEAVAQKEGLEVIE